jgi:hypothetical protein
MKHIIILLILISTLFWCATCEPFVESVYRIRLKNDSNRTLSYTFSFNYPDTLIPEDFNKLHGLPANKTAFYDSKKDWEEVFAKDLSGDTLIIFVLEGVTKDTWDAIKNNYTITKRYDLSFQDLEKLKWTVTYPPDASMAGLKIYPE